MKRTLNFLLGFNYYYCALAVSLLNLVIAYPSIAEPFESANCLYFERQNGEPESEPIIEDSECEIESTGNTVIIHWSNGSRTQVQFSSSDTAEIEGYTAYVHRSEAICVIWNPSQRHGNERTICYSFQ
ncbi:hypothetical protein [Oscillatoria salina]|uniref:hypothetical protein n=1 Tax=Oscillatoria salina TaxID=331517 RepID=UPI0013B639E7|nr:hypothetical protein [Oscillatoria salina]MBZ8179638.1 hypothetical protein [Oscillatoria salina IIICB1]NET86645.1 hypothetical protein [Kamptonema sp. SIO1D9]